MFSCSKFPLSKRIKLISMGRSQWTHSHSLVGIVSSNPTGGHGCLSVVSVVCFQVEFSAWANPLHRDVVVNVCVCVCVRVCVCVTECDQVQQ